MKKKKAGRPKFPEVVKGKRRILGNAIFTLMKQKEITSKWLATKADVFEKHLGMFLYGKISLTEPKLRRICEIVEFDFDKAMELSSRVPIEIQEFYWKHPKEVRYFINGYNDKTSE